MPKAADKAIRRALEKRTRKAQSILRKLSDVYEEKEPDWFPLTLLEILRGALRALREAIEDPDESGVTWEFPQAVVLYPVEWDWKSDDWKAASWTLADLTRESLPDTLKETFLSLRNLYALELVTKGAGRRKSGDNYEPILRHDVRADFHELPEEDRTAALQALYSPETLGGTCREIPGSGGEVELVTEWSEKAGAVLFPGEHNGKAFSVALSAAFFPLVVDMDAREANYPIGIGLDFKGPEDIAPGTWDKDSQRGFWEGLFRTLEEVRGDWYGGASEVWSGPLPPLSKQPQAIPLTSRHQIMGPIPVPRDLPKAAMVWDLTRGLGRIFAGYRKVPDLDLDGEAAIQEAESLFWPILEKHLDKSAPGWKREEAEDGETVLILLGIQEKEARNLWASATKTMNAGAGGPGLDVMLPAFRSRSRFEGGRSIVETRVVLWPKVVFGRELRGDFRPVRFRRKDSPGYLALLERHGPRPYFADGWLWTTRGDVREGWRLGGLPDILFPDGRAALERMAKNRERDAVDELQRRLLQPSLFQDEDTRVAREMQNAIHRVQAWIQKLSVYDIAGELYVCIYEAFHRQRDNWVSGMVRLPDGGLVDTHPGRFLCLNPEDLQVRLNLRKKWGRNWRGRLFEKLEALTTFERQTRTRTGRKVDVGDRFLRRVVDGRRGIDEGADERDTGLGLVRALGKAGAFPVDAFFAEVSYDFMERLITWAEDEGGVPRWGLEAGEAEKRRRLAGGASRKDALQAGAETREAAKRQPYYEHSPRLLTLGNVQGWPHTRKGLAYALIRERTPNYVGGRDSKGRQRRKKKPNRLGGKWELATIDGADFVACNGSRGYGYKVGTWIKEAGYERRTGPGGGVVAFAAFVQDLEALESAIGLRLELPRSGDPLPNNPALETLKTYRSAPANVYGLILKAYLPADLEDNLREHLAEAGVPTVDGGGTVLSVLQPSRPGGLTPEEVRRARKRAGWKQAELAKRVGVSQKVVSLWESAKKPIPAARETRLREVFGEHLESES